MPLVPESHYVVTMTDRDVSCQRPDGSVQRIPFANLESVMIETNDSGPAGMDFWWVLSGEGESGCIFPQGATGEEALLERLTKLPHFDNEAFTAAARSTHNDTFLCWRRPMANGGGA